MYVMKPQDRGVLGWARAHQHTCRSSTTHLRLRQGHAVPSVVLQLKHQNLSVALIISTLQPSISPSLHPRGSSSHIRGHLSSPQWASPSPGNPHKLMGPLHLQWQHAPASTAIPHAFTWSQSWLLSIIVTGNHWFVNKVFLVHPQLDQAKWNVRVCDSDSTSFCNHTTFLIKRRHF